ncbi:MAG TPA: hypothetical protein VM491_21510 [Burkholderiaceae bacterium]|nr:hypothetical protein [Burkholderiaceae bacterium]
MRYLFGLLAIAAMLALFLPIVFKLRGEYALYTVIAIGLVMMLVDMWQDLRE